MSMCNNRKTWRSWPPEVWVVMELLKNVTASHHCSSTQFQWTWWLNLRILILILIYLLPHYFLKSRCCLCDNILLRVGFIIALIQLQNAALVSRKLLTGFLHESSYSQPTFTSLLHRKSIIFITFFTFTTSSPSSSRLPFQSDISAIWLICTPETDQPTTSLRVSTFTIPNEYFRS